MLAWQKHLSPPAAPSCASTFRLSGEVEEGATAREKRVGRIGRAVEVKENG